MKIYTRSGDTGQSSLLGGTRDYKNELVFNVLGNLDELNATLGLVQSSRQKEVKEIVSIVQADIFTLGSLLADINSSFATYTSFATKTTYLEENLDELTTKLPDLNNFILPGGSQFAVRLHLSRAVCRRAERSLVALANTEKYKHIKPALSYINRLSDLLFVMARYINYNLGVKDVIWKGGNK